MAARWITLAEALSWLAFGRLLDNDGLRTHLAKANYSSEKLQALKNGLEKFTLKARDGEITLKGRFVTSADEKGKAALTDAILSEKLADFRAYDITTDGLRFGKGLLWLPDNSHEAYEDLPHTFRQLRRPEHYVEVIVDFAALRDQFRSATLPRLSDTKLQEWWDALSDSQKRLPEAAHKRMLKEVFPNHHVARDRLRQVRSEIPRQRGRPANSR
jgi:hypothetical protein